MSLPLASIIIPVLNGQPFISETLRGVFSQQYGGEIEVIVVDNGSSDDSAQIAISSGAKVIKALPSNRSVARNRGADSAKGEILFFLDVDCWPSANWVSGMVRAFQGGAHAAQGSITTRTSGITLGGIPKHQGLAYLDTKGCAILATVFRELGGFDESLPRCEDIDLGWKLSLQGKKIEFVPEAEATSGGPVSFFGSIKRGVQTGRALSILYCLWSKRLKFDLFDFLLGLGSIARKNKDLYLCKKKRRNIYQFFHLCDDFIAAITLIAIFPLRNLYRRLR